MGGGFFHDLISGWRQLSPHGWRDWSGLDGSWWDPARLSLYSLGMCTAGFLEVLHAAVPKGALSFLLPPPSLQTSVRGKVLFYSGLSKVWGPKFRSSISHKNLLGGCLWCCKGWQCQRGRWSPPRTISLGNTKAQSATTSGRLHRWSLHQQDRLICTQVRLRNVSTLQQDFDISTAKYAQK